MFGSLYPRFRIYVTQRVRHYADDFIILMMDNGGAPTAKCLVWPDRMILFFLPILRMRRSQ